jgi:hypothetical protein
LSAVTVNEALQVAEPQVLVVVNTTLTVPPHLLGAGGGLTGVDATEASQAA